MRPPRFSIASLLAVIGILGVALAALRTPSNFWANVTFSVALATLVIAVINAIYGSGARRAYWLGFAICGGTYFAVCSVPGLRDSVCLRLASEVIFDMLYPSFAPGGPAPPPTPAAGTMATTAQLRNQLVILEQYRMQLAKGANGGNPVGKRARSKAAAPPPTAASRWSAWNEPDRAIGDGYQIGNVSLVSSDAFRQIGHSLMTLLTAVLGAVYARSRYNAWTPRRLAVDGIDEELG
jgi:hypothetical protein